MRKQKLVISATFLLIAIFGGAQSSPSSPVGRRPLRVVLYPFIPEFPYATETVKHLFEQQNPDIELTILDLSSNYYAPPTPGNPPDPTYIVDVRADIYELDSVFLADFATQGKIQELPDSILLSSDELLRNAYKGSMWNGKRYGSAHWACENFLFFTRSTMPARIPRTLSELEGTLAGGDPKLLLDMKGRLTLGELYLGAAYAKYGKGENPQDHLKPADANLEGDLVRILKLCPVGSCRDQIFHEVTGIYGQEFARGRSKALIGYSESLHSVLLEGTIEDRDLRVAEVPFDDMGTVPISWIDSFTVSTDCKEQCLRDAGAFVRFMQRDDVYLKLLLPGKLSFLAAPTKSSSVPAYLLPAKRSLYRNDDLTNAAHLYPELQTLIERSDVPLGTDLNKNLREVSVDVEKVLASNQPK